MIRKLQSVIRTLRVYPLIILLERSQARFTIKADIDRWVLLNDNSRSGDPIFEKFIWLLRADNMEEFRNLFYFRIGIPSRFMDNFLLALSKRFFAPLDTLFISSPSIGAGLVIKHGHDTYIDAQEIGENCLIFQDVGIGYKNETSGRPTIGKFVHISAGAKVLGNISIGDHAVIAANAVVTNSMPANSLALGIPAKITENAGNQKEYIAQGIVPS